jgi:plastocyanin
MAAHSGPTAGAAQIGRRRDGGAEEGVVPALQRLLENIPFLIFIGLVMPTVVYTVWSITELVMLPRFGEAGAHGSPLAGAPATQLPAAAGAGVIGGVLQEGTAVATGAVRVSMRNMAYAPRELEVDVGTTVTWTNDDPFPHAVAHGTPDTPMEQKAFYSGDFAGGSSFSYTFAESGTYEIYCSTVGHYAAGMTMTVVVKE